MLSKELRAGKIREKKYVFFHSLLARLLSVHIGWYMILCQYRVEHFRFRFGFFFYFVLFWINEWQQWFDFEASFLCSLKCSCCYCSCRSIDANCTRRNTLKHLHSDYPFDAIVECVRVHIKILCVQKEGKKKHFTSKWTTQTQNDCLCTFHLRFGFFFSLFYSLVLVCCFPFSFAQFRPFSHRFFFLYARLLSKVSFHRFTFHFVALKMENEKRKKIKKNACANICELKRVFCPAISKINTFNGNHFKMDNEKISFGTMSNLTFRSFLSFCFQPNFVKFRRISFHFAQTKAKQNKT